MKRFAYAFDPLCLAACALYALNRFWLHGHVGGVFFHGYFNALLLIPAALPLALWIQRKLNLRTDDARPRWSEIVLHLAAWALMAEAITPHLLAHATADWRDVIAYSTGGVLAGCWWQVAPVAAA